MSEPTNGRPSDQEAGGDPLLSRLYRQASMPEDGPPAHLDDAIRAAARRAVGSQPSLAGQGTGMHTERGADKGGAPHARPGAQVRSRPDLAGRRATRRWATPLALAASVVLATGIALKVYDTGQGVPTPASSPAPLVPAAPATGVPNASTATAPATAAGAAGTSPAISEGALPSASPPAPATPPGVAPGSSPSASVPPVEPVRPAPSVLAPQRRAAPPSPAASNAQRASRPRAGSAAGARTEAPDTTGRTGAPDTTNRTEAPGTADRTEAPGTADRTEAPGTADRTDARLGAPSARSASSGDEAPPEAFQRAPDEPEQAPARSSARVPEAAAALSAPTPQQPPGTFSVAPANQAAAQSSGAPPNAPAPEAARAARPAADVNGVDRSGEAAAAQQGLTGDAMTPEKAAAEPAQPFTAPDPLAGDWSRLATPEDWLAYLRKLIAGRRLDDARRSVEELKRRWPATELPEDIAAPLTAASR